MTQQQKWFADEEAAVYIGMSAWYLRKSRVSGNIGNRTPGPTFHRAGRHVRYLKSDLDAWLAIHRVSRHPKLSAAAC